MHVVRDFGLNPEGSEETKMFHTWPLYCAEVVLLDQEQGLAYYGQVLWT